MDNNVGKYLIALIKGNKVNIIKTFDNLNDALSFGESEHDKYHPKKGLFCCLHRKERKGFARENYKYLFVDPWVDEMVKDWVDVSKLLE